MFAIGMTVYSTLTRNFFYFEDDEADLQFRLSNPDVLQHVKNKTLEQGKPKLTYMKGTGAQLLACMLDSNPKSRFTIEMLNNESKCFNKQFSDYLTINKYDLDT